MFVLKEAQAAARAVRVYLRRVVGAAISLRRTHQKPKTKGASAGVLHCRQQVDWNGGRRKGKARGEVTKTMAEASFSALAPLRNDPDMDPSLISLYAEMSQALRAVDARSVTVQPSCVLANQHRRTEMTHAGQHMLVYLSFFLSFFLGLRPSVSLLVSLSV